MTNSIKEYLEEREKEFIKTMLDGFDKEYPRVEAWKYDHYVVLASDISNNFNNQTIREVLRMGKEDMVSIAETNIRAYRGTEKEEINKSALSFIGDYYDSISLEDTLLNNQFTS